MENYLQQINPLLDAFYAATYLTITLLDLRGHCISSRGDGKNFCRKIRALYHKSNPRRKSDPFHKSDPCSRADRAAIKEALKRGKCYWYKCHAGVSEVIIPLRVPGGPIIGFLLMGKFFVKDHLPILPPSLQGWIEDATENGSKRKTYRGLPVLNKGEVLSAIRRLYKLAQTLCKMDCLRSLSHPVVLDVIDVFENHPKEKPTVEKYCRYLAMSRHPLDALFLEICGETFACFLMERVLVMAEHLLMNTDDSLEEISEALGYSCCSFSALFKRHYGITPEVFRRQSNPRRAAVSDSFNSVTFNKGHRKRALSIPF